MMDNLQALELCYKEYSKNLAEFIPDGLLSVDLELLYRLDLLDWLRENDHSGLTQFFHVIESYEKITLINDQFVIWIIPEFQNHRAITYVLIALNKDKGPHLELAFSTTGVYNSSKFVLRVLDKLLNDIQENEKLLQCFTN